MASATGGAFSEDLIASFGANTGHAQNNGGSVGGLLAGGSNGGAMRVGLDTTTAGAKAGTVTINYQTAGAVNGVSNGLGVAGANAAQQINVSGNVYQAAAGQLISAPLNFGTVQVGQAVTQMDQATQQNAALVEQSAAAAESLREQAQDLVGAVAVFRLGRA